MKESASEMESTLEVAFHRAVAHLASLDSQPVCATVDAETLRTRLHKQLPDRGLPPADVIEELVRDVRGGLLGMPGPRFFAWVIGGTLPAALAADWLTSAWDQNAVLYESAPAAAIVEEVVGDWIKDLLSLPTTASFALTTGCQMAHVTCLAAARHALLSARGWDIEAQGLYGAPKIRIFSNEQRHASIDRAVRLLGLGQDCVHYLTPNDDDVIDPKTLEQAFAADPSRPTIVLLQAGDINTGSFDPFADLIPIAKQNDAWVHVDGAFGLWTASSSRFKYLTDGVAGANSWATDGHKWLNVPFDCGYAFVADSTSHRAAMSIRAPYITGSAAARDQIDWNPEWSRRARGFPSYAAIRQLGRSGVSSMIERCCDAARGIVDGLAALPNVQVLWMPVINQGLVRFLDATPGAANAEHDRHTEEVIKRIVASGVAFFGPTTWRGMRAMRVSVLNWQTTQDDVSQTVDAIARVLEAASYSSPTTGRSST